MKVIRVIAAFLFIDFVALNIWAISQDGLLSGFTEWLAAAPNAWHYVIIVDLLLALSMCLGVMWYDARKRGRTPWFETVLTLFGSVGPLLYLARRREEPTNSSS